MSQDKALTGAAGEYYVAFHLSAMGYAVGLTARGTKGADLLATNIETGRSVTVQVKTMSQAAFQSKKRGRYWKWRVGVSRSKHNHRFFYVFVDLKGDPSKPPDVFVVPSQALEKKLPAGLAKPLLELFPNTAQNPKDAWCIIHERDKGKFLNQWDVLVEALK